MVIAVERTGYREVISFDPDVVAAADVRHRVEELLTVWGIRNGFDAIRLLVSELVVNVVRHVRRAGWVVIERQPDGVRVEVHDGSSAVPELRFPTADVEEGRGLQIVQSLADRWGVEYAGFRKCVWFEIADPVSTPRATSPPDR
jgi:anti-sigma regulatory factor (Ser/Thr protein kinase)